jgi:DNA-binding Lrp family transcriptional regulator
MTRTHIDDTDVQIAIGLAARSPVEAIAARLGVTRGAVYKRMARREFEQLREKAQMSVLGEALRCIQGEIGNTVLFLVAVRDNTAVEDRDRIRAAIALLDFASTKELTSPKTNPDEGQEYERCVVGPDGVARVLLPSGRTKVVEPAAVEAEFRELVPA